MCAPPLSCCFRFLLKFLILRKFTTTGAGYGLFPSPNPTSGEIPQVRQEFDNPSIIIHFFTAWIGYFQLISRKYFLLQIQGGLLNTFFKPNGFLPESAYPNFSHKKRQIPEKSSCCRWWWHISDKFSSMSREEEFRSVPGASRGKRSVEMRAQKQVVSGQSNAISVVWEQPKMLLPMLSLMFFISSI